jgi:hypothetical protein
MDENSSPFPETMVKEINYNSQLALALVYEQAPEILKKPVQAIHISITGGLQNKTQRLAFNAMLKHAMDEQAKSPDVDIADFSIGRAELMRKIAYTSPNRKHFKDSLEGMQSLKVQWDLLKQDNDVVWGSCVLLPLVSFDRDRIYYSYMPQIKPLLFNPKVYARLDLRIQRLFRLDASAALYDWVNRFRTVPSKLTNEMTWEEWRMVVYGVISEKSIMHEYKMFKRDKLKPAINEINQISDLNIVLIEKKDGGRSVRALQFEVHEKSVFRIENEHEKDERAEWDKRLEDFGVSATARKKMFAEHSIPFIEAHWRFTVDRMNDKSQPALGKPAMYLKRALEGRFAAEMVPKPAPAPATAPTAAGSLGDIQVALIRQATRDAEAMFAEMLETEREAEVDEYNKLQETELTRVPPEGENRLPRLMIPFYSWLAVKYWGEPTPQQLFQYAIDSGAFTPAPPK